MGQFDDADTALWSRSLRGDSAAFAGLFDRHRDRVFHHVRRLVEDVADAEDLTAVAFLELWRRRHDVRIVDESVLPWLIVTAGNGARNLLRTRRRHRRFLATLPPPNPSPDFGDDLADRIDAEPQRRALADAINTLSARDRTLILMTELEGFSLHQASAALGMSYGSAKTRLSRARSKLRRVLSSASSVQRGEQVIS